MVTAEPGTLVERFYHQVWNQADEAEAFEILEQDFRFRGSLGLEKMGVPGFIDYLRDVHRALGGYTCAIDELLVQSRSAAARMTFSGVHRDTFMGVAPTGLQVSWSGAAFFQMSDRKIASLWVLGDVDGLKGKLRSNAR